MDPTGSRIYYGYWLVGAAFLAQFVSLGIYSYVLSAFMVPMIDDLGWTRAEFTLSRSVGQLMMAATGLVVGGYVDRVGGRPLMLIGATIMSVALYMHSHVGELWQWVVLNGVVLTIGCAMIGNLVVNVTLAKWFVERRGQALAWSAMGVSMGGIIITPLVVFWIDSIDWRTTWQLLALCTALIMYPVALMMRRVPEDHGLHPDGKTAAQVAAGQALAAQADLARSLTRGQALRTWTFYALVLAFGLFSINIVVVLLQAVPLLTDAGFTRNDGAFCILVASIPALVSKPVWGFFIDRWPAQPLAAVSAAFTGLSLGAIVLAVEATDLSLIYVGFFCLGIGWGGMIPMQEVIWGSFFGRRHLGAVRSVGLPFSLLLGAGAPLLVSYYHDLMGTYFGALMAVAVLNVSSGVMLAFIPGPRPGRMPVQELF
ncbi:MAG: MFS transporter [Pseudomonadales bacterium]|jgi:predicted MFS family arabinose efflux permease|nr:MFS transporter [Pseudomonadales bacterium]MDP6471503.1 MFS transporter [Pseudomonadales bacterium]MDP6829248.1 MFS transporter [Pseudomonadales bacterium]MDP6970628.1 MFS transporter [Pseudomonadales bacterium]